MMLEDDNWSVNDIGYEVHMIIQITIIIIQIIEETRIAK